MRQRTTSSSLEWVLEKRPALGRLSYVVQCSTAYDRRSSNACNQHERVKLSLPQSKQTLPLWCSSAACRLLSARQRASLARTCMLHPTIFGLGPKQENNAPHVKHDVGASAQVALLPRLLVCVNLRLGQMQKSAWQAAAANPRHSTTPARGRSCSACGACLADMLVHGKALGAGVPGGGQAQAAAAQGLLYPVPVVGQRQRVVARVGLHFQQS